MITPEEVFKKYQFAKGRASNKVFNSNIKDWEKIKQRKDWENFEILAEMFNRNPDMVDPDNWMKAQFWAVSNDPKRVRPDTISSDKAAVNYRNYINTITAVNSVDEKESVKRSMMFIYDYMKSKGLKTFHDYLMENHRIVPTFYMHYKSGKLDKNFILSYNGIKDVMRQVPTQVTVEFMSDLIKNWSTLKSVAISTGIYELTKKAINAINK